MDPAGDRKWPNSDFSWSKSSLHIRSTEWHWKKKPTVPSTSLGKMFYACRFILNAQIYFQLTIFHQEAFLFSVSVLCCQIFNLKFTIKKNVFTCAVSIVSWFFWKIFYQKIPIWFYSFLIVNAAWKHREIFRNFEQIATWKCASNLPTHRFLQNFYYGQN